MNFTPMQRAIANKGSEVPVTRREMNALIGWPDDCGPEALDALHGETIRAGGDIMRIARARACR